MFKDNFVFHNICDKFVFKTFEQTPYVHCKVPQLTFNDSILSIALPILRSLVISINVSPSASESFL